MALELIADNGGERLHRERLRKLLEVTSGSLRVASAYVADDEMLSGIKGRKIQLLTSIDRMDVISGATKLRCLRALMASRVKINCLSGGPRLHAKVYIFGNRSLSDDERWTLSA